MTIDPKAAELAKALADVHAGQGVLTLGDDHHAGGLLHLHGHH